MNLRLKSKTARTNSYPLQKQSAAGISETSHERKDDRPTKSRLQAWKMNWYIHSKNPWQPRNSLERKITMKALERRGKIKGLNWNYISQTPQAHQCEPKLWLKNKYKEKRADVQPWCCFLLRINTDISIACHCNAHLKDTYWTHTRFVYLVNVTFIFADGSLQATSGTRRGCDSSNRSGSWSSA